jgi:hypothetical protein
MFLMPMRFPASNTVLVPASDTIPNVVLNVVLKVVLKAVLKVVLSSNVSLLDLCADLRPWP